MRKTQGMLSSMSKTLGVLLIISRCALVQAQQQQQAPAFIGPPATAATYAVGYDYGSSAFPTSPVAFKVSGFPIPAVSVSGAPQGVVLSFFPPAALDETIVILTGRPIAGSEGTYDLIFKASNGIGPDATLAFTLNIVDGTVPITSGFTGNWYDPDQSGHGFSIEILPDNQMLAQWFVFAPDGGQAWITALGPIMGNIALLQASQSAGPGGRFPPNFDPSQLQTRPWGTITFTFTDCNSGQASWSPSVAGYSSGSIPIQRLTIPAGLSCPMQIDF